MSDLKIIRVFPRRTNLTPTDPYAFIGEPIFTDWLPQADEVHVSCAFTWDKSEALRLQKSWKRYYPMVKVGGPAFDSKPDGFIPGMYLKSGVTFTSRGCNNQCSWCLVRQREGKLFEYSEFHPGNILQDNNFTQCSKQHQRKVFAMLRIQKGIELSGGIESKKVTDDFVDEVRTLRLKQIFLACDYPEALKPLKKAINKLQLKRDKVRCYVLLAFNGQTLDQANWILREVWNAGAMPFAQLYQPPDKYIDYSQEWKDLRRNWSLPAIMRTIMKKENERN